MFVYNKLAMLNLDEYHDVDNVDHTVVIESVIDSGKGEVQ